MLVIMEDLTFTPMKRVFEGGVIQLNFFLLCRGVGKITDDGESLAALMHWIYMRS